MNLAALKSPQYCLYLIGNVFGMNANWIMRLVIGWLAWDLTKSASFVGFVSFLNFSPALLGGPVFGVIVDKADLRKAMLLVQFTITALSLVMLGVVAMDKTSPTFLAVYALIIGTAFTAYQPIRLSLGPRLVRPERVSSVVSLGALNFNISRLTGPAIAGTLIANYGVTFTMATVCALYVPFLLFLARLHPRPRNVQAEALPFWQSMRQGFKFVLSSRLILIAMITTGIFSLAIRAATEVLPIIADGIFERGAAGLGMLAAAAGVGAIVASIMQVMADPPVRGYIPRRALLATLLGSVLTLALGFNESWPVAVALIGGIGFTSTLVGINFQSAVQMQLDDDMRGRVMSLWMTVAVGGTALGALAVGVLIEYIGFTPALGGIGVVSIIIFAALVSKVWR
ncbi:MAG: MFS transporter [Paracoccaceae bacterium]|jgi:MFS family permease